MVFYFLLLLFPLTSLSSFGFNTTSGYGEVCFWSGHTFHSKLEESNPYCEGISLKSEKCSFPFTLGFRVGAAYFMYGECLAFDVNWNRFHAGKVCRFDMDTVDAAMGYTFYRNYLIGVRGFLGVEGALLKKGFEEEQILKERHHFKGVGPLVGLLFQWDMGAGFTFEALGAFASPFGTSRRDLDVVAIQSLTEQLSDHHFIGISDVRCGLRYSLPCLSWYGLSCFLAYEQRAVLGHRVEGSQSLKIMDADGLPLVAYKYSSGGKITLLQGVTFSTEFSF